MRTEVSQKREIMYSFLNLYDKESQEKCVQRFPREKEGIVFFPENKICLCTS